MDIIMVIVIQWHYEAMELFLALIMKEFLPGMTSFKLHVDGMSHWGYEKTDA